MSSISMLFVYFGYIGTPFKLAMLNWILLYKYLNEKITNKGKMNACYFRTLGAIKV